MRIITPPQPAERAQLLLTIRNSVDPAPLDRYEAGLFQKGSIALPYRLMKPEGLAPGRAYPLIVILHGSGAIGADNAAQLGIVAKSWATAAMRHRYPAFVLMPQFPIRSAEYERVEGGRLRSKPTEALGVAMELVTKMLAELPIDKCRVYAIGFSMGASAAWNALALKPHLFAAVVAIAGIPNVEAFARSPETHVLIVHGDLDRENSFRSSVDAFEELRNANVELWRFVDVGHEYPLELLARRDLAEWLFRYSRNGAPCG